MRITFRRRPPRVKPFKDVWFAWYPVKAMCGTWVWMETVHFKSDWDSGGPYYLYWLKESEQ